MKSHNTKFIPHYIHLSLASQSNYTGKPSSTMVFNTKENTFWIKNCLDWFMKLRKRKAFFHHYDRLGLEDI